MNVYSKIEMPSWPPLSNTVISPLPLFDNLSKKRLLTGAEKDDQRVQFCPFGNINRDLLYLFIKTESRKCLWIYPMLPTPLSRVIHQLPSFQVILMFKLTASHLGYFPSKKLPWKLVFAGNIQWRNGNWAHPRQFVGRAFSSSLIFEWNSIWGKSSAKVDLCLLNKKLEQKFVPFYST